MKKINLYYNLFLEQLAEVMFKIGKWVEDKRNDNN